jgi:hypothetical protein
MSNAHNLMLLVQISDVYCGPMFRREALRTAIREINDMHLEIALVARDLTENGLISEFKTATKAKEKRSKRGRQKSTSENGMRQNELL